MLKSNVHTELKKNYKMEHTFQENKAIINDSENSIDRVTEKDDLEYGFVRKEWLGGFLNKETQIVYQNARTQSTLIDFWKKISVSRQTQTVNQCIQTVNIDTPVDKETQMSRADYYVLPAMNKIITPQKYVAYEKPVSDHSDEEAVKKIVKYWRKWLMTRKLKQTSEIVSKKQALNIDEYNYIEKRDLYNTVIFPTSRADFYKLYSMVTCWWKDEENRIEKEKFGAAKKAELLDLFDKEVLALFKIEAQKIKCRKEAHNKTNFVMINEATNSQLKCYKSGIKNLIDSMEIQRARELKEIYNSYTKSFSSLNDRIDNILTLKNFLENYESIELAKEIINLLNREVDLLVIGIKPKFLHELKKRISQLLIELMKKKEINPQVDKYKKPNASQRTYELKRCQGCMRVLTINDFMVHVRMKQYLKCRSCEWLAMISKKVINLTPYIRIHLKVKASEFSKNSNSPSCFMLQGYGIYFLINVIWNGHSALTEFSKLTELRLPRWKKEEKWTPWNCILLTKNEEVLHEQIEDVEKFYGTHFLQMVKIRHYNARLNFKELYRIEHQVQACNQKESNKKLDTDCSKDVIQSDSFFLKPPNKSGIAEFDEKIE